MNLEFLIGLGIEEAAAKAILAQFEAEVSELEKKRIGDKYSLCLHSALKNAGTVNVKAAAAVIPFEFTGEDFDTEPVGLTDAVLKLKEEAPYLFFDEKSYDKGEIYTFVGISPAAAADTDTDAKELSYSEYMRLYRN